MPTFKGCFETLIDSKESLSDVEKFNYLLALLKGLAYTLITSQNYSLANSKLKVRYDGRILIARIHCQSIGKTKALSFCREYLCRSPLIGGHLQWKRSDATKYGVPNRSMGFHTYYYVVPSIGYSNCHSVWVVPSHSSDTKMYPTLIDVLEKRCIAAISKRIFTLLQ